jgi:hypothetical protein
VLAEAGVDARPAEHGIVMPAMPAPRIAAINRCLVEQGVDVHAIGTAGGDLESIFMGLIGSRAA